MKKHNFSAGPSIIPQEVLQKASQAILNFNDSDLSIIEISHRSKDFMEVMEKARGLVKELTDLGDDYEVLFLQGGASLQFIMSAYNLLPIDGKGTYVNTGTWSTKAIKEAKLIGNVEVIASSEDKNFNYIPKNIKVPSDAAYVHYTSNNTIFGTQVKDFEKGNALLVCDMSSDIFSRKIDYSKFDVIYAGAQKNMGPAGTTVVIIRKDILGKTGRTIPSMLNYETLISKGSMFNTPPVFAVYVSMLTLEWLKGKGGIEAIEKLNDKKAALLYAEIDRNPYFKGFAAKEDRSKMNATFFLNDEANTETFNNICEAKGISGLKGHRSVGGYRASIYNGLPIESVEVLIDAMKELEKTLQ